MSYDSWRTNGDWHTCDKCGQVYSDADGGCEGCGPDMYIHSETGTKDDKEGWMDSYAEEELKDRNMTREEAFNDDLNVYLFKI